MKTPVPLFILGLGESGQKMLDCERKEDRRRNGGHLDILEGRMKEGGGDPLRLRSIRSEEEEEARFPLSSIIHVGRSVESSRRSRAGERGDREG